MNRRQFFQSLTHARSSVSIAEREHHASETAARRPQVVFSLIQGLGTNKLRHIFCAVLCLVPRLRKFVKPCSKG